MLTDLLCVGTSLLIKKAFFASGAKAIGAHSGHAAATHAGGHGLAHTAHTLHGTHSCLELVHAPHIHTTVAQYALTAASLTGGAALGYTMESIAEILAEAVNKGKITRAEAEERCEKAKGVDRQPRREYKRALEEELGVKGRVDSVVLVGAGALVGLLLLGTLVADDKKKKDSE